VSGLDRATVTYRLEQQRAVANGILEAAGSTFLLLIAVKWFAAGATAKAFVATGGSVGLLLTPIVVSRVAALGWPVAQAASRLAALGALTFVVMRLAPSLPVYVIGSVITMAAASSAVPLLTQIYQENYPEKQRGRLFARAVMIRIGTVAVFSEGAGRLLSHDLQHFQWLLVIFAVAFAFLSFCLARYPSQPLHNEGGSNPFRAMRFVRADRLFRHTLICWMLMGFANLMMLPLRVEYLANPKYGLALDASQVALFTGVIPNLARLPMSQVWGWLFDRMNFFLLRVILNVGFGLGILTFFLSDSFEGLLAGAIIFGVSSAGGDVAWGLWVTKLAPPERVADYMSVHTFFTGTRGVVAPLVAFHLVNQLSVATLGALSTGLIVLSSLLLLPEIRRAPGVRPGGVLTEEVSE